MKDPTKFWEVIKEKETEMWHLSCLSDQGESCQVDNEGFKRRTYKELLLLFSC